MITDYEDDTHFCLKCHMTIIGLENYINHRKAGCTKSLPVVDIPKSPLPSQLLPPDESFTLKADDFFSSLELQSSTKKNAVPSTSGKTFSGILTRSKTSAVIQATNLTNKDEIQPSKSGKNAWIGGHQLKELGTGDNQTRLIKAVDNLNRTASLKKDELLQERDLNVYNVTDDDSDEFDSDDDEFDEDDDAPPRSFTGGKWKPSSPVSEWNEPPPNFTGGKWKPTKSRYLAPPQSHTKGKWRPASPVTTIGGADVPLPSFTGSKWTPAKARDLHEPSTSYAKGKSKKSDEFPPPGYTKGKWNPPVIQKKLKSEPESVKLEAEPLRKSSDSVQYWCSPCNRSLASKIVYERHLKSELHYKRTEHDDITASEFDDSAMSHSNIKHNKAETTKRTISKPVEYWSNTKPIPPQQENNKDTMQKEKAARTKRIRRKKYLKCEVCRARVSVQLMGKHLISHYHCRKGDITRPEARQMVLDNIHDIVLQSPYQCSPCKFYCNTPDYFLQHWSTQTHTKTITSTPGFLWCIFCKFKCIENSTMLIHLHSNDHAEVINAINRSVPIVIKKINPVKCSTCNEQFLLNIQLWKHCEKTKHPLRTNIIKENQNCRLCNKTCKTIIALQRHLINVHKQHVYYCSICLIVFESIELCQTHKNTPEHKYAVMNKSKALGSGAKKCEYCLATFEDFLCLKKHLKTSHPEHTQDCPHCGQKFTISQDVTVHIRSKSCKFLQTQKSNTCNRCPYSSDSIAELLFHKALHQEAVITLIDQTGVVDSKKKPMPHYKCPLCDKFFVKASLKFHIKNHTNEKQFVCQQCPARFARKSNWKMHLKNHELKAHGFKRKTKETLTKGFLCSICGNNFNRSSTLQKHMLIHTGKKYKCDEPGCFYAARTASEIKSHRKTHSNEKNYACTVCDYRGKSKQQLKRHETSHDEVKKYSCSHCKFTTRLASHLRRHERLHSGVKPYACPHCQYRCNNLENLRKHVLSTNKHPGKCIYECKFCEDDQFQSNFAKDFKVHLITAHTDVFESRTEAAGYIAGIYDSSIDDHQNSNKDADEISAKIIGTSTSRRMSPSSSSLDESLELDNIEERSSIVAGRSASALIANNPSTFENNDNKGPDDLFPMFIIDKDDVVCVDKNTWSTVASFDVEASGALVSFNEEGETFFQEQF